MISDLNQTPDLRKIRSERAQKALRDHRSRHKLVQRKMKAVLRNSDPVDAEIAAAFWLTVRKDRQSAAMKYLALRDGKPVA